MTMKRIYLLIVKVGNLIDHKLNYNKKGIKNN